MKILNREKLLRYTYGLSAANESVAAQQILANTKTAAEAKTSVFISHSHKDKDLVLATADFLRSHGIKVYIDWLDEGMPETISGETAVKIKERINQMKKFLVLVTENSKDSRWVPWELGYADPVKGIANIACLPVFENDRDYDQNEYLRIYPSIEYFQNRWILWTKDPSRLTYLDDWLNK